VKRVLAARSQRALERHPLAMRGPCDGRVGGCAPRDGGVVPVSAVARRGLLELSNGDVRRELDEPTHAHRDGGGCQVVVAPDGRALGHHGTSALAERHLRAPPTGERAARGGLDAGRTGRPIVTPDDPEVCRSALLVVEIPAIVRLHEMVKLPTKVRTPPLTRRSLLLRDSYQCAYCLEHADTIDHVVPRSRGGRHEWTNVVAACRRHNMQKGDRLLEELGWRLHFEPRAPDGPWWRWRHVPDPDPLWAPFLPRAS
jgi:hypothetical protein